MTATIPNQSHPSVISASSPGSSSKPSRRRPPNFQERCLGWGFTMTLRMLSSTWRVDIQGLETLDGLNRSGQRYIMASWHRHYLSMVRFYRNRSVIAVTNESHRGQVIADICDRNGIRALQIPMSGTKRLLRTVRRMESDRKGIAIMVDGPLGPPNKVKRAIVHLAADLQFPIIPVSVSAAHKYVVTSRWDRLEVPHFFSHVKYEIGAPLTVPSGSTTVERIEIASKLEQLIAR
jgi:lysophospholipid acyltransferase (LPLAT)-like uncharacterized protein